VGRWVLAGTLAALTAITVVPFLAHPFRFVPLPPGYWLASLVMGLSMVLLFQLTKRVLFILGSRAILAPEPAQGD
jgi:Ca2+-transporting ATPase